MAGPPTRLRRRDRTVPARPNLLAFRALDGVVVANLSADPAELAPDSETLDPWQIKVGSREARHHRNRSGFVVSVEQRSVVRSTTAI